MTTPSPDRWAPLNLLVTIATLVVMLAVAGVSATGFLFVNAADSKNTATALEALKGQVEKLIGKVDSLPRTADVNALGGRVDKLEDRMTAVEIAQGAPWRAPPVPPPRKQ